MIIVSIGTPQRPVRVVLDEIAGIAWSTAEDCPVITLKGTGAHLYALGFVTRTAAHREQKVADLEAKCLEAWRAAHNLTDVADSLERMTAQGLAAADYLPPAPAERAVRDVSPVDAPLIDHGIVAHLDDPIRRRNCRYCNPGGSMDSDPAAT